MLESEMKLSERSEFFISGSAFNQILRPLFFLQFRNGSRFPHPSPPSCAIWQAPDIFGYFSTDAPFGKSESFSCNSRSELLIYFLFVRE